MENGNTSKKSKRLIDHVLFNNSIPSLIVDTIPKDARGQSSINLGLEILKSVVDSPIVNWWNVQEEIPQVLYFNIFYPTHIFNMLAFLRKNKIPFLKEEREQIIIVGGQGVSNLNGVLDNIVDLIFKGEIEGYSTNTIDSKNFFRAPKLESPPVIKDKRGMIELTRGCKYRCGFCEYGNVCGGKYREKDWELVKSQIDVVSQETKCINFLSANLGAYSKIDTLLTYCCDKGINVSNSDITINDFWKIHPYLGKLKMTTVKIGVESFSEKTRFSINKKITDKQVMDVVMGSIEECSNFHFYLIYGLPNDDYQEWFKKVKELGELRRSVTHKSLRFEFSVTNFEPCLGTPMQDMPQLDFNKKSEFLKEFVNVLKENGFIKKDIEITYGNCKGRFGRKENSYKLLMALKTMGPEITEALTSSFKNGVGRSILDDPAEKFLNKVNLCKAKIP